MAIHPCAGKTLPKEMLTDIPKLLAAYHRDVPDPSVPAQLVSFGTSGHRGSSLARSFNERHILAITQAICQYRREAGIFGPLFMGMDTHALSAPAFETALEVLAGNGVQVMIAGKERLQMFQLRRVSVDFFVEVICNSFACYIILCGSQAAGGNHYIRTF